MTIPSILTVDLTPHSNSTATATTLTASQLKSARDLVATFHRFAFVSVTGHGLSQQEITEMFAWSKKMLELPFQEKMKVPHAEEAIPHRGYSRVGREKLYARDNVKGGSLRGGEKGHDVLPGFRSYVSDLNERLASVGEAVVNAIAVGLSMSPEERDALMQFSFTLLFQHQSNALELLDPKTKQYLRDSFPEGALTLNVSDMLQRFTNAHPSYFISALHRISVPSANDVTDSGVPARYSIPLFVAPHPSHLVQTLPRFVSAEKPCRYESIRFQDDDALAAKYTYREGQEQFVGCSQARSI
ncbi:hypothetical protein B0T14DRAFT_532851 [Immersiella caudata]|uniref:Non-haem dioxygenase N-terminal domain-containing protein n=1 Tax=Immersiella caudata TaxID=314043 RepID=A0AA39XEW8_9PEZI|nr:hypothetical protein B0T14DRAFT_532851 [Immersiella caudata]